MIIHNFDAPRTAFVPFKTYSPLVVDPDAVLSVAVACQLFQTVARRHPQIRDVLGGIDPFQFPHGDPFKSLPSSIDIGKLKEGLVLKGAPILLYDRDEIIKPIDVVLVKKSENAYDITVLVDTRRPLSGGSWLGELEKYHGFWVYTHIEKRDH